MKQYGLARLSVLLIGLAITSPIIVAQVASNEDLPSAPVAPARPSNIAHYPSTIAIYTRPTERQKLRLFEFDAFGPYAFAKAGLNAAYQQHSNAPPEWGQGAGPFGERFASSFGIQLSTTTTRYGMAELLREDAAYYPCECKGFVHRFRHAVISTVTARHGLDGHTTFSLSGLVSPYAGSMTALAWYPSRYGVQDGLRMGNYNLAIGAVENLALEFLYGGPHSMFSHVHSFKAPGGDADKNP